MPIARELYQVSAKCFRHEAQKPEPWPSGLARKGERLKVFAAPFRLFLLASEHNAISALEGGLRLPRKMKGVRREGK